MIAACSTAVSRPFEGHLDEGDQGADAALLDHLLVLLIGRVRAARAAIERVQPGAGAAAEADHPPAGDRLGDGDPFAFRVGGDDDLVAERDRPGGEGLDRRGFAGPVGAEHEDVGGERAPLGGVDVGLPGGEVPQRVGVQVDPDRWGRGARGRSRRRTGRSPRCAARSPDAPGCIAVARFQYPPWISPGPNGPATAGSGRARSFRVERAGFSSSTARAASCGARASGRGCCRRG